MSVRSATLSVLPHFYLALLFLLLLIPHPTTASTYYISFSPAIYIADNSNSNSTTPAATPQGPSSPTSSLLAPPSPTNAPYSPSPSDLYNPQTPSPSAQAQSGVSTLPTYASPSDPAPAVSGLPFTLLPPSSGPMNYDPATPLTSGSTVSCATIGEPWWVCTSTQRCAFDDAGDVACCPVGEFCRGVVNYGAGLGPMQAGRTSGGEKMNGKGWVCIVGVLGWVVLGRVGQLGT